MKPWGSQHLSACLSGVFSPAHPFTPSGGVCGRKNASPSPARRRGGRLRSGRRLRDALDYSGCGTFGRTRAGPAIRIRRAAHSFGHPSVTATVTRDRQSCGLTRLAPSTFDRLGVSVMGEFVGDGRRGPRLRRARPSGSSRQDVPVAQHRPAAAPAACGPTPRSPASSAPCRRLSRGRPPAPRRCNAAWPRRTRPAACATAPGRAG